jgi:RNA polymerase sigma-70 factor, ECF subfamily
VTHDELLVRRAQRGDQNAVDSLLRQHYDTVRAVCHRIVINSDDADDATQMALIAIVRALPSFDGRSKFSTWVYRIATNAALDEVRRIRRRAIPHSDETFSSLPVNDDSAAVDAQLAVSAALSKVPEEFRVVLVLRHIADLEYDEIAVILDIPVGTVRSRLSRGRTQLSELLGNPDPAAERQTKETGGPP